MNNLPEHGAKRLTGIFGVVDQGGRSKGREIREWSADLSTERTVRPDRGLCIACSPDGDWLAVLHYGELVAIDSEPGKTVWMIENGAFNYGPVTAVHNAEFIVVHRIGVIPVGESALYVRAVAPHRREAFVATMELIERLKKDVPIWKHPVGD